MTCIDIIMYRNGLYKEHVSTTKYNENKEDVRFILMNCFSEILGEFYVPIKHKVYKKFNRTIKHVKLSYDFINDIMTQDIDYDDINKVSYSSQFTSLNGLLTKVLEILISEGPLNDLIWLSSSDYCYYYDKINLKIVYKNGSKTKISLNDFLTMVYGKSADNLRDDVMGIHFHGKKSKYNPVLKFKDLKLKSDFQLLRLGANLLVPADFSYVAKLKKLSIAADVYLMDECVNPKKHISSDYIFTSSNYECTNMKDKLSTVMYRLWELPMFAYVVDELVFIDQCTHLQINVSVTNKDGKKMFKNWTKLYDKVFG